MVTLYSQNMNRFTDEQFARAKTAVINGKPVSDSQLYKMAGNAVTVNVIKAIANKLKVEE